MKPIAYVDFKNREISHVSYSARETYKFCRRKFRLTRIDGWSEKRIGASLAFGRSVEAAVQYHVQNNFKGGPDKFAELWERAKSSPDFDKWEYTKTEVNYGSLMIAGYQMLRLFELQAPSLPIYDPKLDRKPVFQMPLRKEIFPGTKLAGLENTAYLDIVTWVSPSHPRLPALPALPAGLNFHPGSLRKVIIDCKTSGKDLNPSLVCVDPQLMEYAWQAHCLDVAFLWFAKKTHGLDSGSYVTLLEKVNDYEAGDELRIIAVEKNKLTKKVESIWIGDSKTLSEYDEATCDENEDRLSGNALKDAKLRFFMSGKATLTTPDTVTKQRLQFAAARLLPEDVIDAGKLVGQTTVEMLMSNEQNFYPKEGGTRFPNEKCNSCSFRYICIGDSAGRDEKLRRFGEEWLDGSDVDQD